MTTATVDDIIDSYDELVEHLDNNGVLKSVKKYEKFLDLLAYTNISQSEVEEIGQEFIAAYNSKHNTKLDENAPAESASFQLLSKLRGAAKIFGGIGFTVMATQSFQSSFRLENGETKISWDLNWKKEQIVQKVRG